MQPLDDDAYAQAPRPDAKKKTLTATEQLTPQVQEQRKEFIEQAQQLDPEKLVFLDEAGSNVGMTRDFARAPRGERAHDDVPRNRGTVTSMLGAMGLDGVRAMMTIEGATTAEVFQVFVERFLVPVLRPGEIVILDNLGAHKPAKIQALITAVGARVLFLPPYSPDLNPIEHCWSKLKALLKRMAARTRTELDVAIAESMELITTSDINGWFRNCGYAAHAM